MSVDGSEKQFIVVNTVVPMPNSLWHIDGHHKLISGGLLCTEALMAFQDYLFS